MLDPVTQVQQHVEHVLAKNSASNAISERVNLLFAGQPAEELQRLREQIIEFGENYIRSTVWMLGECDQAAAAAGLTQAVGPVLIQAAAYFINPQDYLPDQYGILGLLDDAYLCCRFMAEVSALYQAQSGIPLIDVSLDKSSPTVFNLIGAPLNNQLDALVSASVNEVLQRASLATMQPIRYRSPAHWQQWVSEQNTINVEAEISSIVGGNF